MKPKTLFITSMVALAMGAFIFFYEKDLPSTDERAAQEQKILVFEPEEVEALTLRWGGEEVQLEKQPAPELKSDDPLDRPPEPWRIVSPVDARADREMVDSLLQDLERLERRRTLNDPDLAGLGLDTPQASVLLRLDDAELELHVGDELPLSGDRALRGKAEDIAFQGSFGAELLDQIQRSPTEWRDKLLFVEPRNAIQGMSWIRGDQEIRLQRFGDGERYRLVSPVADASDANLVRGLLTTLVALEAAAFVDEAEGFGSAQATFEVTMDEPTEPWLLELGYPRTDRPDHRWARFGPKSGPRETVELASSELFQALERPVEDWRSKGWATFQVFSIEKATFVGVGEPLTIERGESGDWSRNGDRIEYAAASDALYPFTEIEGISLMARRDAESQFDLSSPRLTATLATEDREEVLHLYRGDGELSPATLEGRDTVLLIEETAALDLLEKIEALRSAPTVVESLDP